jgi:hypothetical protein
METVIRYAAVLAPISFIYAIGYTLETGLHIEPSYVKHLQIWSVALAMLFASGYVDKIIFRYVTTDETKKILMRTGFVGILFLVAFMIIVTVIG